MAILRAVKYLALAVALIAIVIGAIGGMKAGKESARLKNFCGQYPSGTGMEQFRATALAEGFSIFNQNDVATETKESQIAARLVEQAVKSNRMSSGQVAAIVRKPGIGYYACLVNHDGKALLKTEYIWND